MFRRRENEDKTQAQSTSADRITSVLGEGISWNGKLTGQGGVRVEGSFEGEVALGGMLVVGPTGRVTSDLVKAQTVIVAGLVRGDIMTNKLEIRSGGKVWGDVTTINLSTEEGAFLRGKVTMEEELDLGLAMEEDGGEG